MAIVDKRITQLQKDSQSMSEYRYDSSLPSHTNGYLWPIVTQSISECTSTNDRLFDLGCGNASFVKYLGSLGHTVTGVDPSESGIAHAKRDAPGLDVHVGSAYDRLWESYGQFKLVISLEVVEHVYAPKDYAKCLYNLVAPGGTAIVSTPFHGYWKNLLIAATGKFDAHFTALWDHGHIKFWSRNTLSKLLTDAGFESVNYRFAGRIYPFSKSMVAIARRSDD